MPHSAGAWHGGPELPRVAWTLHRQGGGLSAQWRVPFFRMGTMSATTKASVGAAVWNLPNQLTLSRLALSCVLFALLAYRFYLASFALFVVAASTDWLDGYFARKWGQVTVLGRILDPFVDKVIVCGSFIFLVAEPHSGVKAWMTVVVVGRELLITAIRGFLEQHGADFSAQLSGKLKMVLQCVAVGVCLFALYAAPHEAPGGSWHALCRWLVPASLWLAVAMTVFSGVAYVRTAMRLWDRR